MENSEKSKVKNLYMLIFKNLKSILSIFVIGFIFNGCHPLITGSSIEPYSKEQILDNESLIVFSASRDKKIAFNDRIDLGIENIDTKEEYALGNTICHEKLRWTVSMFVEQKPNLINTDDICGNVYIAKLPFGHYKINTIYIRTFDSQGMGATYKEYQVTSNNTFTLNSTNETLYLGSVYIKPLTSNLRGEIFSLELTVSDYFDRDIDILKTNDFINKDLIFIDKSLDIPTTLIKNKPFW